MAETKSSPSKIILRWFSNAFIVFVLTLLSGAFLTLQVMPKVYTATAEIQVRNENETIDASLDSPRPTPVGSFNPQFFQALFEFIQSPDVLQPVITDLNLDQVWAKRFHKGNEEKLPPLEALNYMHKILRIDLVRGTNIVRITASSEVPQEASDIANAIADQYKKMRDAQEDHLNTRGEDSLRQQMDQQQKVVDDKKASVDKLRTELEVKGVATPPDDDDRTSQDLNMREKDLLAAKEDADARKVLVDQTKDLSDEEFLATLEALGRSLEPIKTKYFSLKTEADNLVKAGAKESDPQVSALREQMKNLVAGLRRAMQIDLEMAKSRVILLQNEVDDLTVKVQQSDNPQLAPFRQAQSDYKQQLSLLDAFKVRLKQIDADRSLVESPVRIISRAQAPRFPSSPNKALCLAMTVLAGIILGPLLATVMEIRFWISRRSRVRLN